MGLRSWLEPAADRVAEQICGQCAGPCKATDDVCLWCGSTFAPREAAGEEDAAIVAAEQLRVRSAFLQGLHLRFHGQLGLTQWLTAALAGGLAVAVWIGARASHWEWSFALAAALVAAVVAVAVSRTLLRDYPSQVYERVIRPRLEAFEGCQQLSRRRTLKLADLVLPSSSRLLAHMYDFSPRVGE